MDWRDESYVKYWAWLFLPGHCVFYVWIANGIWFISGSIGGDYSLGHKVGLAFTGAVFGVATGLWFLLGTYQVMWIDIKKKFIPYRLSVAGNEIEVKGLYLKSDTFTRQLIHSLTHFEAYTHWYRRVHTLFLPNVEHYKLTLTDGRAYHFHGNSTGVRSMLVELTGIDIIQLSEE